VDFEKREENVLKELCQLNNFILATGGGTILSSENRKVLSTNGTVFYLKASADTLFSRTKSDSNRPLLKSNNKMKIILELLKHR